MVEPQPSKLIMPVRSRSAAPGKIRASAAHRHFSLDSPSQAVTAHDALERFSRARCAHGGAATGQPPAADGPRADAAHVEYELDDDLARRRYVSAPPQEDIPSDCPRPLLRSRSRAHSIGTSRGLQRILHNGQRTERSLPAGPVSVATAASTLTNLGRVTYYSPNALPAVAGPRPCGKGPLVPRRFDRD